MPTGYTARIKDGISFREFAMDCARAFGACVELRDEGGGGERIPEEFKPDDHYSKRVVDLSDEMHRVLHMNDAECAAMANAEYEIEIKARAARIEKDNDLRQKYTAMLEQVHRWEPPTLEHQGLKDFMIQQLMESIRWDCPKYSEDEYDMPKHLTGREWRNVQISTLQNGIKSALKHDAEARKTAEGRTRWVRELRKSLPKE